MRAARKAVKTVAGRAEPVPGVIKGGIWPVLSRDYKGPRDPKNTKNSGFLLVVAHPNFGFLQA